MEIEVYDFGNLMDKAKDQKWVQVIITKKVNRGF
jgi:hypothetical protein